MQQNEIQNLLDKVNLLFSVLLKDGIQNTTPIERELLKEQLQKLLNVVDGYAHDSSQTTGNSNQITVNSKQLTDNKQQEIHNIEFISSSPEPQTSNLKPQTSDIEPQPEKQITDNSKQLTVNSKQITENKIKEILNEREYSNKAPQRQINQIIDINKSFILRQELFNNNNESYKNFVQHLEQIDTEKNAFAYLSTIATEQNWNTEEKAFELMVKVVEKRFIPIL